MGLFFSQKPDLQQMVASYLEKAGRCMDIFREAFLIYLEKGECQVFQQLVDQVDKAESSADEQRRQAEITIYEKALIPESRGDILGVMESVDRIPNKAQSVIFQIDTERLNITEQFKEDFRQLVEINSQIFADISRAVRAVFENIRQVRGLATEISRKEKQSDIVERGLIRKVFQSQLSLGEKILLKELIIELGNISDRAEDTADRLSIIAAKRLI